MKRLVLLILISMIPSRYLRIILYRWIFGFTISKDAKIAMLNLLDVQTLVMEDYAEIRGIGNVFTGVHKLKMGAYSRIGGPRVGMNFFRGTANKKNYPPAAIKIGKCSVIELFHYFDVCGDILIGDNTVVGGIRSVFFTHSIHESKFEAIKIGNNVYIGSNCSFQMGAGIPDNCVLGMGAVIVSAIKKQNALIAGVPAHVAKENFGYCAEKAFQLRKLVYFKDGEFIYP